MAVQKAAIIPEVFMEVVSTESSASINQDIAAQDIATALSRISTTPTWVRGLLFSPRNCVRPWNWRKRLAPVIVCVTCLA